MDKEKKTYEKPIAQDVYATGFKEVKYTGKLDKVLVDQCDACDVCDVCDVCDACDV